MSFQWRFHPEQIQLQQAICHATSLSPIAAKILTNRGITTAEDAVAFLQEGLSTLADPFLMSHMGRAVDRVLEAISNNQPIVIYGDSDVDGVSGTALLTGFIRGLGADVTTYIPNRLEEGYSLTTQGMNAIRERKAKLVITVDNGTTSGAAIADLQESGIDVIVCDHHEPSGNIPDAYAILNPKWSGCGYPFKLLCGTAVAFKLLCGIAERVPIRANQKDAMMKRLHDSVAFVAMATICDLVPLVGENRIMVRAGIAALTTTEHVGLKALLRISRVGKRIQADDIGFRLGPRINAAGRLGQADEALDLLLATSADEARKSARTLDNKNASRQHLEADIAKSARDAALCAVERDEPVLVLANENWHAGVVGIVASRLMSEFGRPAILIASRDGKARGSGRSNPEYNLFDAFSACSKHLVTFGGHSRAAGLEIETSNITSFRNAMIEYTRNNRIPPGKKELMIDSEIPLGSLNASLMAMLERVSPFGEGNSPPLLVAPNLELEGEARAVGKSGAHLSFTVKQGKVSRRAIAYGMARDAARLNNSNGFQVAFVPRLNLFRGAANVDLDIKDIHFSGENG